MDIKSTQWTTCYGEPPAKHISVRLGGPSTGRTCQICGEHYIVIVTSNPRPSVSQVTCTDTLPTSVWNSARYERRVQAFYVHRSLTESTVVTICTAQWLLYVPPALTRNVYNGVYSCNSSCYQYIQFCIQLRSYRQLQQYRQRRDSWHWTGTLRESTESM